MAKRKAKEYEDALDETTYEGFSYINRKGEETTLSPEHQRRIIEKITSTYDSFEKDKNEVTRRWKKTERAVRGVIANIETDRYQGLVPYGKQSLQTLISHFWGRSFQTDKILFSVRGKSDKAKENAPIQKQYILKLLKKMKFQQKMDDAVFEALMKGVCISHTGYKHVIAKRRTLSGFNGTDEEHNESGKRKFVEYEQTLHDEANYTLIDPHFFVFDTSNHEEWDSCFKAYKTYMVLEDIIADENFENYDGLEKHTDVKDGGKSKIPSALRMNRKGKQEQQKGGKHVDEKGRLEVIEFHGDYRLPDGTYLRNWTIVVAGRDRVIRFEENPYYVNPFDKWTYERTDDGWGVSPLDYIVPLINAGSHLLNSGTNAGKLAINPPMFAEKGTLPQKKIYLSEGKVVEYTTNESTKDPKPPQVIPINPNVPFNFLQLFESQAQATTGATRQLSGNVSTQDKDQTATEFQGLQMVGNMVIDRSIDLFNLFHKIPIIEKIALITSMFNSDGGNVLIENDEGEEEFKDVTEDVIYGEYDYEIEDSKSEMERKRFAKEKMELFREAIQDEELNTRLKKKEIFADLYRDLGHGRGKSYIKTDEDYVIEKLKDIALEQFIIEASKHKAIGLIQSIKDGNIREVVQQYLAMEGLNAYGQGIEGDLGAPEGGQELPGVIPIRPEADPGMAGSTGMGAVL